MLLRVFGGFVARVWACPSESRGRGRDADAIPHPRRRFARLRLTLACCAGLSCGPLLAGQYDLGAGYSLTYDSNITHTPTPRPDWTNALFFGAAYEEHTVDFNARGLAQGEFRNYLRNVFPDDHSAYINGAAVWTISPQLFSWMVEENFRQVQVNLTQPDVPTNRTEISAFSTGPDFTLRFDSTNRAEVGGRYERFDIRGPGDNQRVSAFGRLIHRLSEASALSANYEATQINFDDSATFPRVVRTDGFIRLESRQPPHELTVDIGTSRVLREGAPELDGRLARLVFSRQLTPESVFQAGYISQYSDTFTDSLRGISNPMIPGDTAIIPGVSVVTADSYYLQRGDLAYVSDAPGTRFGFSVRGYARSVDYLTQPLDFREWGAWLDLTWRPDYLARAYFTYRFSKRDFQEFVETDKDSIGIAGVTYSLNRNVTVTFEASRLAHVTTVPASDWVDWRAMVLLGYSTGPLFTAVSRR